jgi:L-ribulokinase
MAIGSSEELASSVYFYPSGEEGILLDADNPLLARQHPKDYVAGMLSTIQKVLKSTAKKIEGFEASQVKAIGFATTGSSVIPVDKNNQPLAFDAAHEKNLNAMCWVWKDHTSSKEAVKITELAKEHRPAFMESCGGAYSSEWFWAKIWHLKNNDEKLFDAIDSYVELCDFLPAVLAGESDPKNIKRSVCAAGHKALYSDAWGGLPDKEFLEMLDPKLAALRDRLYDKAYPADQLFGVLGAEWAEKTGLAEGTKLAVGAFDAHLGAVGAGVKPGTLVKIMGTSTCDLMITENEEMIEGVCGTVKDSVIPGYVGIEAGQSGVGDLFLWLVHNLVPESYGEHLDEKFEGLTAEIEKLAPGQTGLLALDWNNGNRSVLTDMQLSGLILGQTLHTKAHEIYLAMIEATAFGALKIIERLSESGAEVKEVVCCGGLAKKNDHLMQVYTDIINRPIKIAGTDYTCAVGAAISAASVATSKDILSVQGPMVVACEKEYLPRKHSGDAYRDLYWLYKKLHDCFGVKESSHSLYHVMKDLHRIRGEATRLKDFREGQGA